MHDHAGSSTASRLTGKDPTHDVERVGTLRVEHAEREVAHGGEDKAEADEAPDSRTLQSLGYARMEDDADKWAAWTQLVTVTATAAVCSHRMHRSDAKEAVRRRVPPVLREAQALVVGASAKTQFITTDGCNTGTRAVEQPDASTDAEGTCNFTGKAEEARPSNQYQH